MYIFTLGSKFTYRGVPNDYLTTFASILKKWIIFVNFTGYKDLQEIPIYLYGISKVNIPANGPTTCS